MRTVARLVYSYFTGTRITCALTIAGIILCVVAQLSVTYLPQTMHMLAFAMAGQLAILLGASLMPLMFGRLAQGHALQLMPFGRLKLLISAFVTVMLVALPMGVLTPTAAAAGVGLKLSDFAAQPGARAYFLNLSLVVYTWLALLVGWLYLALWFLAGNRNRGGLAKALVIIVLVVFLPVRQIEELSAKTEWNLIQLAIVWGVFGAGFLAWPRLRSMAWRRPRIGTSAWKSQDTWGREVAMILGTHNPWLLVGSLVLPVAIASKAGVYNPEVWLFMLTIFSTVTGAIAGQAAQRSRALWLRQACSRIELFVTVERAFWRHNAVVLGLLMAMMVGIASFAHLPGGLIAGGLPLLVLGTVLSTYLGLMLTRGLRLLEITLGSAVMLTLMSVALLLGEGRIHLVTVYVLELALLAMMFALRAVAKRRWSRIDWIECRPAREFAARGS
ncbi:MAG TPA: hypothetical protein VFP37_07420 [Steroidobacteraceae bacterium]|nr:hypothetical protein [Steroidobacteraceae bacterium]